MFNKTPEPPLASRPSNRPAFFPQDRCAICRKVFEERAPKYRPPNLLLHQLDQLPNTSQIQDAIDFDCRTRNKPCGHWATCTKRECNMAYYGDVSGDTNHADPDRPFKDLYCQAAGCHQPMTEWEYWVNWNGKMRYSAYAERIKRKEKKPKPAPKLDKVEMDPVVIAQYKRSQRMEAIRQGMEEEREKAAKKAQKQAEREEAKAKKKARGCCSCPDYDLDIWCLGIFSIFLVPCVCCGLIDNPMDY
ncbi:hypothetical protein B0T19DRAFT_200658 [Cercophora scortea]|uniref:Uncharacterized protein n=1 Tax=Cercophora scortea TaxID=314031 RepID=A0AAE0IE57_9PEZI|nr:hypothetical protein B0T19DRAFT_200658 [Cercophora scortea]